MRQILISAATLLALSVSACADDNQAQVQAFSPDEIRADASVLEGRQYISTGQPDQKLLELAKEAGYRAVIDLRTPAEDRGIDEAAAVESLGMHYVSFPVAGSTDINLEKAAAFDRLLGQTEGPVLLHCRSGNRVGAMLALDASRKGASEEDALKIGKEAGLTSLESSVKTAIAKAP